MKSNERIMAVIKQREFMQDPFLTVGKILEVGGMVTWTSSCCNRIADAGLIDGEEVRIDFFDSPNIEITAEGMRKCRGILESYVSQDVLKDAQEALCWEEAVRSSINEFARSLKEMKWCELYRVCTKGDEEMQLYAREEARQRFTLAGCRAKLRKEFYRIVAKVKYRKLISFYKNLL